MNVEQCAKLFALFAALEDITPYQPLLDAAVIECRQQLKEGADESDIRLCYYCAAIANLRYTQMIAARSTLSHTYAGTLAKSHDETIPHRFAERLWQEYRALAKDLLRNEDVLFSAMVG
ncbi:MAG: hypothetical protein IKM30_00985 [Oscillospiraceae bacterium]|nr:hypothetical protein [Oscillospiraceae bacterium]